MGVTCTHCENGHDMQYAVTTWHATSRKETTCWRESSALMNFEPGLMNQSSNINRMVTCWITTTSQIPPKPSPCEIDGHCAVWHFNSDCVLLYSTWKNSDSRLLQKLPPETVTSCCEEEMPWSSDQCHHSPWQRKATYNRECKTTTGTLGMESIGAPSILLDLSAWDFDLIPKVKEALHGRRFLIRDDIPATVNQEMSKFTYGEASDIQHLPHHWQRNVDALWDYFEGLRVRTSTVSFKLPVRVVISDE